MRAASLLPSGFGARHLALLSLITLSSGDTSPRAASWATKSVGPDGPWNVVNVSIGDNAQYLSLFPGRAWQTVVPTSLYCTKNASISHCAAGSYKDIQNTPIQLRPNAQDAMAGIQIQGKKMTMYTDTIDIAGPVPNCSLVLLEDQMMVYPSGKWFPMFAGCLNVGAPTENQTFSRDLQPGSEYPWYLYKHNNIPSSSFGMHIGSTSPASTMSGSLNFGGFDRNRVTGNVLTLPGSPLATVPLTDISIKVIKGKSPFAFSDKTGLLISGNSSMPKSGIPVSLDGCSPYFTLPKSTCDSISTYLPVTYNNSLGLYLWNTKDHAYQHLMKSASTLSFTIMGFDNTKSITINVPFQHLNLTLDPPLVDTSMPYFPCSTGGPGFYSLGRAFLQDAFLAANWGRGSWWLAQAPGPNIPSNPDVVSIDPSDVSISGSNNDWVASWDTVWSDLAASEGGDNPPSGSSSNSTSDSGLSAGAKGGIGAGVGVGFLIVVLGVWFWWRKRQGQDQAAQPKTTPQTQAPIEVSGISARNHQFERYELS
ncbi:hypothetical protein QQS21_000883 [Conoideocrella luteorostrata]|uniref:Peptidase A1 domain-containing protein n=1 Tax=Conoideocrella luteorostrata TaxID=1105319 RepID=A0AAJ0CYD9_9HYPO|nr:hypothetical protein QQS21_000883 [Conoideocrella luteorostrata]